jgi:hypothetical protein
MIDAIGTKDDVRTVDGYIKWSYKNPRCYNDNIALVPHVIVQKHGHTHRGVTTSIHHAEGGWLTNWYGLGIYDS